MDPIKPGTRIAQLDQVIDEDIHITGEAKHCSSELEAVGYATEFALSPIQDAVVMEGKPGDFWVAPVEELAKLDGPNYREEIRNHIHDLKPPRGMTLQSFAVAGKYDRTVEFMAPNPQRGIQADPILGEARRVTGSETEARTGRASAAALGSAAGQPKPERLAEIEVPARVRGGEAPFNPQDPVIRVVARGEHVGPHLDIWERLEYYGEAEDGETTVKAEDAEDHEED